MRDYEVVGVVAAFAILIVITLFEVRRWLPANGRFKVGLVFLAGAGIVGSLWATGIPPWWFDGGKEAFGLAITLFLGGFVAEREKDRTFGFPLLAGMGVTLAVLNVISYF